VLQSPMLQRFVLNRHERAFARLLPELGAPRRIVVVGGGLFPRTALILRRLLPDAAIAVVDLQARHLDAARGHLDGRVELIHARYDPSLIRDADLVVVPLAYRGDRDELYRRPPAPNVLVHDWIWVVRPFGVRVSWLLLKRLNLVRR
jgi:hypothetical protein